MVRTQILLPDDVYRRAKEMAAAKEMSLAELMRRGLELLLGQYPEPKEIRRRWRAPIAQGLGWKGLSHREIRDAAQKSRTEGDLEAEGR